MSPIDSIQHRILTYIAPAPPGNMDGSAYAGKSKVRVLLGDELVDSLRGKTVMDFGCGAGAETMELAGIAKRVIGIDIVDAHLEHGRQAATKAGIENVEFTRRADELVDVIVSLDAFEHFSDLSDILRQMHALLKPGGYVAASFGPTWYHPLGGHLFSVFPWAHVIFSETALCRWRSRFRSDGATRFHQVEGGLNQISIRQFESVVAASDFQLDWMELKPIRKIQFLHNRLTREFTTAIVRAKLVKR